MNSTNTKIEWRISRDNHEELLLTRDKISNALTDIIRQYDKNYDPKTGGYYFLGLDSNNTDIVFMIGGETEKPIRLDLIKKFESFS